MDGVREKQAVAYLLAVAVKIGDFSSGFCNYKSFSLGHSNICLKFWLSISLISERKIDQRLLSFFLMLLSPAAVSFHQLLARGWSKQIEFKGCN